MWRDGKNRNSYASPSTGPSFSLSLFAPFCFFPINFYLRPTPTFETSYLDNSRVSSATILSFFVPTPSCSRDPDRYYIASSPVWEKRPHAFISTVYRRQDGAHAHSATKIVIESGKFRPCELLGKHFFLISSNYTFAINLSLFISTEVQKPI